MKKYYFRLSFSLFLILLLPFAFLAAGIYLLIISNNASFWGTLSGGLLIIMFSFMVFVICRFHIAFDNEKISITEDIAPKEEKVQYRCFVKYEDVISIDYIISHRDSRNKVPPHAWISMSVPKTYLEIKTNSKTFRFCLSLYSSRQRKNIVNELIKRCQAVGNNLQVDDANTMYKKYLIKKKESNEKHTKK